jgi:HSP20 family protein
MSDTKEPNIADRIDRLPTFGTFRSMQEEMDRMLQAFAAPHTSWRAGSIRGDALGLRVDIGETEETIVVTADLPGIAQDDVDITLEDDLLRIRAEKNAEAEHSSKEWHVTERSFGTFERAIRVPLGIDPSAVSASYTNGVLTISLPKPAQTEPSARRISVNAG